MSEYVVPILLMLVMLSGCTGVPSFEGGGGPIGADKESLVNEEHRRNFQINSNVAVAEDGSLVVTWASKAVDGDGYGIVARFYDEHRRPITGEVPVNLHTANHQKDPDVAVLTNGNVVVTWESWYQERDDGYEVYARVFDDDGTPVTEELRLNRDVVDYQRDAAVAATPGGGFVAAWLSWDVEVDGYRTYARLFDASGDPTGAPVRLTDAVVSTRRIPDVERNAREVDLEYGSEVEMMAVDTDGDGNAVLVWTEFDDRNEGPHVIYRRFDDGLQPIAAARPVESDGEIQYEPSLDVTPNGEFIVAWHNGAPTDDGVEAFARTFDREGHPMIGTVQLNSYTEHWQNYPVVAMRSDGRFAAAWESNFQDGDRTGIFFRRFDANGSPVGPERQVNSESESWQEEIDIGMDREGNTVVTFMSYKESPTADDIYARYFPATLGAGEMSTEGDLRIYSSVPD